MDGILTSPLKTPNPFNHQLHGRKPFDTHLNDARTGTEFFQKFGDSAVYAMSFDPRIKSNRGWVEKSIYASDFSADADGWTSDTLITLTGNVDSIGGQNDNLELAYGSSGTEQVTLPTALSPGVSYKITFDAYHLAANTTLGSSAFAKLLDSATELAVIGTTEGSWESVSATFTAQSSALTIGEASTATNGDKVYIRNVTIKQVIKDPVVHLLRDSDSSYRSFTAPEVASGVATNWVRDPVKSLVDAGYVYFNGVNQEASITSAITLSGDFAIKFSYLVGAIDQRLIGQNGSTSLRQATATRFTLNTDVTTNINLYKTSGSWAIGTPRTLQLKRVSGSFGIYDENNNLLTNQVADASNVSFRRMGAGRHTYGQCVLHNIYIDLTNDGTWDHHWIGNGTALSNWEDQIGSADVTALENSPAAYNYQIAANGYIHTAYDPSGNGNDATQTTVANMPKLVDAGVLVTDANGNVGMKFDGVNNYLLVPDTSDLDLPSPAAWFTIFEPTATPASFQRLIAKETTSNGWNIGFSSTGKLDFDIATTSGNGNATVSADPQLVSWLFDFSVSPATSRIAAYIDGVADTFGSGPSSDTPTNTLDVGIGARPNGTVFYSGIVTSIFIFNADMSSQRPAIEAALAQTYGITLA